MMGYVTISRLCSSKDEDVIRISFRDEISRNVFAEAILSPSDFAKAVTGLSEVEADISVYRLETVGKKKVVEQREVICPFYAKNDDEYKEWLIANAQEDGYLLDTYLGSKGSITLLYNKLEDKHQSLLRYKVIKYVD
jgi:hypothetical protein